MTYSANRGLKRSMTPRQISWISALVSALAMMTAGPVAWAGTGTSTVLNVTPTNPSSGAVISLQAVVQSVGVSVPGGTVTFSDTYNGVTEPIGTVQVQSANGTAGTALLETEVGGPGVHQFLATFNGTSAYLASNSSTQAISITFSGTYLSSTAFTSTASSPYTLTGTVSAFGTSTPTGNVTFTDTTVNATVGTAALSTGTLKTGFTPYTSYPLSSLNNGSSGNTVQPAIGDFNGDGRPDYVVPANGGTVNILLGKGDGTFTTGTAISTTSPFSPCSVVVGDFNGDGKQDIAVLSAQGIGSVNTYLGNGDGTFQAARNYPVATATSMSRALAVGDFNQDGIQDLAATNYGLNQVTILRGNGDGSFQAPVPYSVNSSPINLVVGDINHDGVPDIAVSSYLTKYVSILTGNGDGTFKPVTLAYTTSNQVGAVALGDFNGDGWLDLATSSAADSKVYILINSKTATPSFATAVAYSVGTAPYTLTVGDFTRDGFADVITANNSNATVSVFSGTGTGTLGAATAYAVGGNAIFVNVGDLNGDDQVDVAAVTPTGLSVLLAGKTESASLPSSVINGCGAQSVTATYAGDTNYATSTSSALTFTPTTAATTLNLNLLPPNAAAGSQFVLQATLAPYNYGSTTTNGELVTFYNNGISIGTAPLASGVASLNYTMPTIAYSFQAKYTADCAFQASSSNTAAGLAKLASTITWPTPAAISFGTALSATQLDATDNAVGGGTFVYSPAAGTKLNAGTNTLTVVFTPTNTQYGQESKSVQLTVNPAQTYITWPPPAPISYGTPLSSFQLDAYATLGTTNVNLSSAYNVYAIYKPGATYSTGGFDADGYSYSTSTLGTTLAWNGLTFNLGQPNVLDAVSNTTIPLPAGNFAGLFMLGAMVNNVSGPFIFTVNYTDGSSTQASFNMSDWVNAAGYSDESVISCAEDRNYYNGTTQVDSICVYGYSITLDPTKIPLNVVLPNTRNIVMLSMDLTTPKIPGTYVYTPPAGTIEPVGTQTLSVAFTPTSSNYTTSTGTVPLVVGPPVTPIVTTTISWPTPSPITYGTPLSSTQLDATATGASRPTPASLSSNSSVLSTSNDGVGYGLSGFNGGGNAYSYNALNNGSVNYAGATFTLGTPDTPNAITNGAVFTLPSPGNYSTVYLIGAAINGGNTNVPFTLTYQDGNGNVTDTINMSAWYAPAGYAGESIVAATTYVDNAGGGSTSVNVDLYGYQLPADPTRSLVSVTLPATRNVVIMGIGFGTNQQVTVPGTYTYNPVAGTIEPAGTDTLNVSFTPTNTAAYSSATGSTTLVVNKATPVITWANPAPVVVGTALSSTQLNATATTSSGASLPGTFVYNPAAGKVLSPAGTYTLNVTFTPTDTTDYKTVTASVQIIVGTNGNTTLGGGTPSTYADCCFFAQPTPYTITVGGVGSIPPSGTVGVALNGVLIGNGTLATTTSPNAAATFFVSSGSFYPGNNAVSLLYSGDGNYTTAITPATIVLRNPAIVVNASTVNVATNTTIHYQFAQAGYMTYSMNPVNASSSEFTDTGTGTCKSGALYPESAGFDCTFIVAFKPVQPGTRRGVIQVNFMNSLGGSSMSEPTLYLFLSGTSSAAQIALSSATQTTLNTAVNQPQNAVFSPTDANDATLYIANSSAAVIDTLSSNGGNLTQWNQLNTTNLKYPSDVTFDAFDNLVVPDASTAAVYSYAPSYASTTLSIPGIQLGEPTQARFDLGGYLYITDGGNTPQVVAVPAEAYQPAILNLGAQSVSFPQGLGIDNTGANLYIGDGNTNQVLQVALNGNGGASTVSQVAIAPCDATVTSCAFSAPAGFAFDPNGDMFVTDGLGRVLKVPRTHSSTAPTTLMPVTGLVNPSGITLDGSGNLYITDVIGTVVKLGVTAGAMKFPSVGSSLATTVTNTGNLPLSISAVTLGNGSNSSFTESDTCKSASVAAGGTCTITLKYATAAKGFDTVTITSNAFSSTAVTIALSY